MPRLPGPIFLARTAVFAVLLVSLYQIKEAKPPWKTMWAKHLAEGKDPTVAEHVEVGMWHGAAARAAIAGLLLAVSLGWRRGARGAGSLQMELPGPPVGGAVFWGGVVIIVGGALAMRLPRMTQSLWGDEADAVSTYIHGQYRPMKKKDPQGPLYFEDVPWGHTIFSARHGPNNHVLFSVAGRLSLEAWRKVTHRKPTAFAEWPVRLPSLLAGLGSLVALACLLRKWGTPLTGLLASAFMALHPWHVRYSTEARGYALALLFLPLVLLALTVALERRRWRDWMLFGLMELLLMLSWAGAAYPLVFINLALAGIMLGRAERWQLVNRGLTVSLVAAAAFISVYAPQLPQIRRYNETHLWMKGMPMDATWLHNILASPLTGMPYHGPVSGDSGYVSWQRLLHDAPGLTVTGFGLIAAAAAAGLVRLWKRQREIAVLVSAVLLAAVVSVLHFKFVIGDELRTWYLIFTVPALSVCVAEGLMALGERVSFARSRPLLHPAPACGVLAVIVFAWWPMNRALMAHAPEDFKGVMSAIRGEVELFEPKGRARALTCWLWRYAALYDPWGEIHVRDGASLSERMAEARATKRELFVIVGYRELAEGQNAEMLRVLEDPMAFRHEVTFPGYEPMHTLEVYRMKPPKLADN